MESVRQQGFSLLELLVTLFVIVLVTSLVSLNIGSGDREILLRAAVQGLADSANYALDEAQFSGMNHGLMVRMEDVEGRWRFRFDWWEEAATGWRAPASGKDVFAAVELPVTVEVELELDGVLQEQETFVALSENPQPQLVLYSSGETLPGVLDIRDTDSGDLLWRLQWDLLGNFRPLWRGQDPEEEE